MTRVEITLACPLCGRENLYGVDPENLPPEGVRCSASLGHDERGKPMHCQHNFMAEELADGYRS